MDLEEEQLHKGDQLGILYDAALLDQEELARGQEQANACIETSKESRLAHRYSGSIHDIRIERYIIYCVLCVLI